MSTSGGLGSLSSLAPLIGLESNTVANTVSGQTPTTNGGPVWLTGKLAQISIIVLGLLLIAAGLFSFNKTREFVLKGAKTGAALAA